MKRLALLLGFYSVCGQVLLLRELVAAYNGDELFIGTALFGWLLAVAVGAYIGGKSSIHFRPVVLLVTGALVLQLSMGAARLSPLLVVDAVGEIVPFGTAAIFSILLMFPVSFVAGLLFSIIARSGWNLEHSIIDVYLWEGVGAFIGGLFVALAVLLFHSAVTVSALAGAAIVVGSYPVDAKFAARVSVVALAVLLLTNGIFAGKPKEMTFDQMKFGKYEVLSSLDTHYGHQVLMERDGSYQLVTDNRIEAVYPDVESAESTLLPPLLYVPDARELLVVGRAEFGLEQLADSFPDLRLTALDPRKSLSPVIDRVIPPSSKLIRINDDPISYFSRYGVADRFDIVIVSLPPLDSYRASRLLTAPFLRSIKMKLSPHGVVAFSIPYDTERYITAPTGKLISSVYRLFTIVFGSVAIWPGDPTTIFAGENVVLNQALDSLTSRLGRLRYTPVYLNNSRLADRLQPMRIERLKAALDSTASINSVEKPLLPYYHFAWRTQTGGVDASLVWLISEGRWWTLLLPLGLVVFLVISLTGRNRQTNFSFFLYFVAGAVSLSLELLSFYLFQSAAGSLYSAMAVLIGSFMLGLAFGTYYSRRAGSRGAEFPALALLLMATLAMLLTYKSVPQPALLLYHSFFLFAVATGAGALFVAATDRYYAASVSRNSGSGYAFELAGSSVGALLCMTLLLPILGLGWLLVSEILLLVVTLAGSLLTRSR